MPHSIRYNQEEHIIEIHIQGLITLNELKAVISDVSQAVLENNCFLILGDYREATLKLSTFEIYEVPKIFISTVTPVSISEREVKRALVVTEITEDFRFLETVSANRGQPARLFTDVDKAKAWLLQK